MDKDIQFFTNTDGDAIAYTRFGRGPLLVVPPGWVSHLSQQWELPGVKEFFTKLARHHTLLIFDKHGTGLSNRNRTDFSLEKDVRDLEGLIEAVDAERFSVFGYSMGGPLAVLYAARNPDRIDRLILYGTFAEGGVVSREGVKTSMISLVRASWGMGRACCPGSLFRTVPGTRMQSRKSAPFSASRQALKRRQTSWNCSI